MNTPVFESELQYIARIKNERQQRNQLMADAAVSPLTPDQMRVFENLCYFPIDMRYKVSARFTQTPDQRETLTLSDNSRKDFKKYGTAEFMLDGNKYVLNIYEDPTMPELSEQPVKLFVPFADATSGISTSDKGRYIPIQEAGNGTIELDFNRAYNTFAGYNNQHVSVLAPQQNKVRVDFSRGQRKFEDR